MFEKGERYNIRNTTITGKPCIEGTATIVKVLEILEDFEEPTAVCLVHFDQDAPSDKYRRYVKLSDKIGRD